MSELKSQAMRAFIAEKKVTAISEVRLSEENGYAYVTMISDQFPKLKDEDGNDVGNGALNIFFSKNQAEKVEAGQSAKEAGLGDLRICHTTNEAGEARLKIGGAGESTYTDVADL